MINLEKRTKAELIDVISTLQLDVAANAKKVDLLESQLTGSKEYNYEIKDKNRKLQQEIEELRKKTDLDKTDYNTILAFYINKKEEYKRVIATLEKQTKVKNRLFWISFVGFTMSLVYIALNHFL